MKNNWLWDVNISEQKAKKVLSDENNVNFIRYAALLFSRNNVPKEVFLIISKENFCRKWTKIKNRMRKNKWNDERIVFWDEIYEYIRDDFKAKGVSLKRPKLDKKDKPSKICLQVAESVKNIRKKKGITQKQLALKMKVSQQVISRIESGQENISIKIIEKIAKTLQSDIIISVQS